MTAEVPMIANIDVIDQNPRELHPIRVSLLSRMKQGTRVIRVIESGDHPCIDMCMLQLSQDEDRVCIIDEYMNTVTLDIGSFAKVANWLSLSYWQSIC